jgi:hypothetical protein
MQETLKQNALESKGCCLPPSFCLPHNLREKLVFSLPGRTSFTEKAILYLKEKYCACFDSTALKSELLVMFSDPDMAKDSVCMTYINDAK